MTDEPTGKIRIREQIHTFPRADTLNAREWNLLKEIAGVRSGELMTAMLAGDVAVLVAFAHIALRRAGAIKPSLDDLWELNPVTDLELIGLDDDEPDPTTAGAAGDSENGNSATRQNVSGSPPTAMSST